MRKRILAGTDLEVSGVCLGGGNYGDKVKKEEAFRQLDMFFDAGGNFIDTANVYCRWVAGENCSETIIGEWLKSRGRHSEAVVATKGGHYDLKTPGIQRVNETEVRKDLEESLRSLGLECVPFYWLHRDDETQHVEEIIGFCEKFAKEGKIRYYGVSNWTSARVGAAMDAAKKMGVGGIKAVSNQYSLGFLSPESRKKADPTLVMTDPDFLEWHEKTGMPLIPYTSSAGGFYAKLDALNPDIKDGLLYDSEGRPDPEGSSLALSEGSKLKYLNPVNLKRYECMKRLSKENGWSMMDISIGYLAGLSFPVIPAVSATNPKQLCELIRAAEVVLPPDAAGELKSLETD